ncbi:hypothetical protein FB384_004866, partial [Prauserella sediminis]
APAPAPTPTGDPLCVSYIGARVIRVTRLDSCGRPVYGPRSQVVTKGFTTAEIDWETEDGEDYTTKAADGTACITGQGPSIIKWSTASITFCRVDPELLQIMNPTWHQLRDYHGRASGVEIGQDLSDSVGFALEMWPKAANAGNACLTAGQGEDWQVNGYVLLPWCLGTAPESWSFEDAAVTFSMNARTNPGSLWGRGPYNITHDADGAPAPLPQPFDPGFDVPDWDFTSSGSPSHVRLDVVDLVPPQPTCGAQALWNDDATAPTITVTANSTNASQADLSVTNWTDLDPRGGVVDWGELGLAPTRVAASGDGTAVSPAYTTTGEKTITFTPANGAEPVTATFTPTLGGAQSLSTASGSTSSTSGTSGTSGTSDSGDTSA